MKLIPTTVQWESWTLPSKASYAGLVIGALGIVLTIIIFTVSSLSETNIGQPQLSIRYSEKPYLRHKTIPSSGLEFSYEICIINSGQNPAIELIYEKFVQNLVVGDNTIKRVEGKERKNPPPKRLVSGDDYCQIFRMYNDEMTSEQINNCLKKYEEDALTIILELVIQYKDAITGKVYFITERNQIFKDKVLILDSY
jgi:hypothetical protein